MIVMIPIARPRGGKNGLATLESNLKDWSPADILNKMSYKGVRLSLPKFTIRSKTLVGDYLRKVFFISFMISFNYILN